MKSGEELQQHLYTLLQRLQEMARELPEQFQQRIPNELLAGLANCLLNETIFEIVRGLTEIQHGTEKQLLQQRMQLLQRHKGKYSRSSKRHREKHPALIEEEKNELLVKQRQEVEEADMNLIRQLDQLVANQQATLQKVGVPGFHETTNQQEIQVQTYLLDFINKLDKLG
nr:EOG090X0GJG [Eulimnadia texana]